MAALGTSTLAHAAKFQCFVAGQNPNDPNAYTELLHTQELEVATGNGAIVYATSDYVVSVSKGENTMTVASSSAKQDEKKIFALASAETSTLNLIDGQNKISVYCKEL